MSEGACNAGAEVDSRGWADIWKRRQAPAYESISLTAMLAADGYDSEFGSITESAWRAHVERWVGVLELQPGMSVYEIGCGAGAFLYVLYELGYQVGGLDISPGLIDIAKRAMPAGDFQVADAASFSGANCIDVAMASGVFMYFPSGRYANTVLRKMAQAARHAVLVLDLPDRERRSSAIAHRVAALGGPERYAARYDGLDHRYYRRVTMASLLAAEGYAEVDTRDVCIDGYGNGPFRFDLWGMKARTT